MSNNLLCAINYVNFYKKFSTIGSLVFLKIILENINIEGHFKIIYHRAQEYFKECYLENKKTTMFLELVYHAFS